MRSRAHSTTSVTMPPQRTQAAPSRRAAPLPPPPHSRPKCRCMQPLPDERASAKRSNFMTDTVQNFMRQASVERVIDRLTLVYKGRCLHHHNTKMWTYFLARSESDIKAIFTGIQTQKLRLPRPQTITLCKLQVMMGFKAVAAIQFVDPATSRCTCPATP